jgi:transcriptional regulator with XRE-family HTH domain
MKRYYIGDTFRVFRQGHNMSQIEAGKILGLNQSAISRIESGEQELSAEELFRFCEALHCPVAGFWYVARIKPKKSRVVASPRIERGSAL